MAVTYPQFKEAPKASDEVFVTHLGPNRRYHTLVYLFSDVAEELLFNAQERDAYGMLTGEYFLIPPKSEASPTQPQDFIEVTAFKDIFPTDNALEYAHYLRRQHNFRNTPEFSTLGMAVMKKRFTAPSLEDLMLMRSYFASPNQIALFIDGEKRTAHIYMLDDVSESFAETGYFVIHIAESPCPLNNLNAPEANPRGVLSPQG